MLICRNLTLTLPDGRVLLKDLTFSMDGKGHFGMISEEGNGKSTLLKLFAGEQPEYVRITGFYSVTGRIGLLHQQIPEAWLECSPLEYLIKDAPDDPIEAEDWNKLEEIEKSAAFSRIDLDLIDADHSLRTCSGGEKVRLAMLKVVMKNPDLFLLDEPTNDLDQDSLEWMERWIQSCPKPVLFVSHDTALLKTCAQGILHLEQRNKKTLPVTSFYPGGYEEYLRVRQASRERTQQIAAAQKREYKKQKERLNDLHNKVEGKLRTVSRQAPQAAKNLKDKMHQVKSSQAVLERETRIRTDSAEEEIRFQFGYTILPPSKVLADLKQTSVQTADKVLIRPFDLKITGKDRILITGKNGSGKSLLLSRLKSLIKAHADPVIGFMPQNYESEFKEGQTPVTFLEEVCDSRMRIQTVLGSLHFTEQEMNQSVFSCSGGQKAKLYLARLSLMDCQVLLLDEPTRNLSPLSVPVLLDALDEFQGCILVISHDRSLYGRRFTRALKIEDHELKEADIDRFQQ